MKKLPCILAVVLLLICISGCSFSNNSTTTTVTKSAAEIEREEFQQARAKVVEAIKDRSRNPDSLQIHNVRYRNTPPTEEELAELEPSLRDMIDTTCKFAIEIDCSAQNGFGGMERTTIYALYYDSGFVLLGEKEMESKAWYTYVLYRYVEK